MKRTMSVLLMMGFFAGVAAPAICGETAAPGQTADEAANEPSSEPVPPPTPYEYDITEAVFARFPGINRGEVDQLLQNSFADELRTFRTLAVEHQTEATDLFSRLVREVLSLLETKRTSPSVYAKKIALKRLESTADKLAREIRLANGGEKKRLQESLRQTASAVFDAKQELMKADLDQMSRELALLKDLINKRAVNRDVIVNRRVSDLVGNEAALEW